jgi:hypothetical protein
VVPPLTIGPFLKENDTANDARPLKVDYQVLEEAIYDAIYVASADGFNASGQVSLLTATQASVDAIELDTGTTIPATIATIDGIVDAILVDTSTTLDTKLDTLITAINTEIAELYAEMVTVRGEPAQGAAAASANLGDKIDYLYKAWRNKHTQTATLWQGYNDAGAVVDQKRTIASNGTTFTGSEIVTGP